MKFFLTLLLLLMPSFAHAQLLGEYTYGQTSVRKVIDASLRDSLPVQLVLADPLPADAWSQLALALMDPPASSSSDTPTAVIHAPIVTPTPDLVVTMPPATAAAPVVPKFADVAACYIAAQPGVIGQCVANPGSLPPLDSRAYWTTIGFGLGASVAVPALTWLVTHFLPPEPMK